MNKPAPIQTDPTVLAVLHRTGATWRGMIVSTRGTPPTIVQTREFASDQFGRIDSWLEEHRASQVLCVLPSSCVICRNCSLPDAPADQLEQALRLQAEAHLLGMAPPHRLAMAVLPSAQGETSRNGLILAWPEAAEFSAPVNGSWPVSFVPDVAAIAAMLNGNRPTQPLLWLDRADGSMAMALAHAAGAVFRGTHEDGESNESWQRAVGRMVAETGLSVGHTGSFIESTVHKAQEQAATVGPNRAALFAPAEAISSAASQAKGASTEESWWSQWGIAVGALLARLGPLNSLTQLQASAPIESPSRVRTILTEFSRPSTAAKLAVACLLILALGPLLVQATRLGVLAVRYGDLDKDLDEVNRYKAQAAVYQEMQSQNVWPMTKLLGDIVSNAPEGIELEIIKVEAGQTFAVSGTSRSHNGKSPTEVVALMQDNLRSTRQFEDVVLNWGQGNNMGIYKFDMSAKIARPYKSVPYDMDRDFRAWTLQARQAGDPRPDSVDGTSSGSSVTTVSANNLASGATNGTAESGSQSPPEGALADSSTDEYEDPDDLEGGSLQGGRGTRRESRSSLDFGGRDTQGVENRSESGIPAGLDIPPVITQEQIDAMSKDEARAELFKRAVAERNITDAAEKERVTNERRLLIEHLKKRP